MTALDASSPSPPSEPAGFDAYCSALESAGGRQPRARVRHHLDYLFGGVDFSGRRVLDIGAGDGALGFYAACMGAASVVCVEPEADGSTPGVLGRFERIRDRLPEPERVALAAVPFQEFDSRDQRFDLIFSKDSVNHFDEAACAELHRSDAAVAAYRAIFGKIFGLAEPGATLILTDCSRRNLFGDLGLRNPFYPMVDWRLHQTPRRWARLLADAGFVDAEIRWKTFYKAGGLGRALLGNAAAAYLLQSHFRLALRKPA